MSEAMCKPMSQAGPQNVIRSGMGITDLRANSGTVFETIAEPKARLARIRTAAAAYEGWRDGLPLDPSYGAVALGWPLDVELYPGYLLDGDSGLPSWEAERAVEGLLAGEPRYIELASGLLVEAQGCILEMPGGIYAVLIGEKYFPTSIKIREPVLLLGGGEAGLVPQGS